MRCFWLLALAGLLGVGGVWSFAEDTNTEPLNTPPGGFTALFDGKSLDGWQGSIHLPDREKLKGEALEKRQKEADALMKETWSVKDGILQMKPKVDDKGKKHGLNLATVKGYRDFELLVDWKIDKGGDSGIYLRGQPQVQIWDSDTAAGATGKDKHSGSGGLWNNPEDKGKRPLKKADKPVGEWNHFRIILKDDKVTVYLNGTLVVEKQPLLNIWEPAKPLQKKGPIELQYHGDPLWFRNIYVKELRELDGKRKDKK
jgi:Domain of Unknown Function (DUF1080)